MISLIKKHAKYIVICALLSTLPVFASSGLIKSSAITLIGTTLIYTIAAIGFNVLLGYSGLISLGTAGFMGLGAYLSAYFTGDMGLSFELSLILSVFITSLLGLMVGFASLRIEGHYLAIATLAVSEILRKTFEELDAFTGGFSGKSAQYPTLFGTFKLDRQSTYIFIAVVLLIVMIVIKNMMDGQIGRGLNVMRGSEHAASSMGVNLLVYKLIAFTIATALAALAGVLYVHFIKYSYPSTWNLKLSLDFMAMIVIGGFRSITGTLIGAMIVFAIPDLLLKQIPFIDDLSYILNGIMIIVVILFYPLGLSNLFSKLFNKVRMKFVKKGANNDS